MKINKVKQKTENILKKGRIKLKKITKGKWKKHRK